MGFKKLVVVSTLSHRDCNTNTCLPVNTGNGVQPSGPKAVIWTLAAWQVRKRFF